MLPTMDLPSHLVSVFWTALAILGVSGLVLAGSLNLLADGHRPRALRIVWITGALMVASGLTVIILLVNTR